MQTLQVKLLFIATTLGFLILWAFPLHRSKWPHKTSNFKLQLSFTWHNTYLTAFQIESLTENFHFLDLISLGIKCRETPPSEKSFQCFSTPLLGSKWDKLTITLSSPLEQGASVYRNKVQIEHQRRIICLQTSTFTTYLTFKPLADENCNYAKLCQGKFGSCLHLTLTLLRERIAIWVSRGDKTNLERGKLRSERNPKFCLTRWKIV